MRTASGRLFLPALLLALCEGAAFATPAQEPAADREAALLHRQLDLLAPAAVQTWHRSSRTWQPLNVPPAAVYVVNLWSVHCKPCVEEFPLFKNILAGWRNKPEVQFLFIADPPSETSSSEAAAFWQRAAATLPDADPCRATTDELRRILEDGAEPLTLLLDSHFVIRQAFIGAIGSRPLGRSIERLLSAARDSAAPRRRHGPNTQAPWPAAQ